MCRNHSHIIAEFLGEDTSGAVPVLTFGQRKALLEIETPGSLGSKLTLQTTGLLYLPSWMLGTLSESPEPPTRAPSISLFLLPVSATTTMSRLLGAWLRSPEASHPWRSFLTGATPSLGFGNEDVADPRW